MDPTQYLINIFSSLLPYYEKYHDIIITFVREMRHNMSLARDWTH